MSKLQKPTKAAPIPNATPSQSEPTLEIPKETLSPKPEPIPEIPNNPIASDPALDLMTETTTGTFSASEDDAKAIRSLHVEDVTTEEEGPPPDHTGPLTGGEALQGELFVQFWGFDVWEMVAMALHLRGMPNADAVKTPEDKRALATQAMQTLERLTEKYPKALGWMKSGISKEIMDLQALATFAGFKAASIRYALTAPTIEGQAQEVGE